MEHEIYALCFVIYFMMTGRIDCRKTNNPILDNLIKQRIHTDVTKRPKDIKEIREMFRRM